jgi:hypothetical protein
MKRLIATPAQLVITLTVGLVVSLAPGAHAEDHECSLARAAGKWSFTDNGTVVGVGPRVAVGTLTLDSAGNVSNGAVTSSLNGTITSETASGTYTVNPDCTGTFNLTIYSSGVELFTVSASSAFDNRMRHLRGIFTSVIEPNGTALAAVIGVDANKQ